jgi:hypothetical protein
MIQKIEGKFYPLQHDEWVRACQELTPSQRDVLYFIRTLDPYGKGLELSIAAIARQLSTNNKTVHRSTISRALKKLDAKGFIDMELLHVKVNIKAKGVHCCDQTTVLPTDNSVVYGQQARSLRNKRDREATSAIVRQQARSPRNKREPKDAPDKESSSLRSNKTYKDYIDSLSQNQREEFLEFGRNKAAQLPKPPALPQKWIERNWQELAAEFCATSQTPSVDPILLEREQKEQISAARTELAELAKRQQEWKEQDQGAIR